MPAKEALLDEKKKMLKILDDLQRHMREIDSLKKNIEHSKIRLSGSPQKSKAILEEIKVPPLQLLKESSGKK